MTRQTFGRSPLLIATSRFASATVVIASRVVEPTCTACKAVKYGGNSSSRIRVGCPWSSSTHRCWPGASRGL